MVVSMIRASTAARALAPGIYLLFFLAVLWVSQQVTMSGELLFCSYNLTQKVATLTPFLQQSVDFLAHVYKSIQDLYFVAVTDSYL